MFFHNESLSYIRDLKVMNDRRDFELTSSDKNIEIRPEAVMFISRFSAYCNASNTLA